MKILGWILSLPVALIAISFAVCNLAPVDITLWPLPGVLTMPAFALVLISLVVGFALGGFVAWLSGGRHRRALRQEKARADQIQRDLDAARLHVAELDKRSAPVGDAAAPRVMALR